MVLFNGLLPSAGRLPTLWFATLSMTFNFRLDVWEGFRLSTSVRKFPTHYGCIFAAELQFTFKCEVLVLTKTSDGLTNTVRYPINTKGNLLPMSHPPNQRCWRFSPFVSTSAYC